MTDLDIPCAGTREVNARGGYSVLQREPETVRAWTREKVLRVFAETALPVMRPESTMSELLEDVSPEDAHGIRTITISAVVHMPMQTEGPISCRRCRQALAR